MVIVGYENVATVCALLHNQLSSLIVLALDMPAENKRHSERTMIVQLELSSDRACCKALARTYLS